MFEVVAMVTFDTSGTENVRSWSNPKNKLLFVLTQDGGVASH